MEKRIQRVRHEIKMREVEVASVRQLAPNYLSVTFKGETLHDFISASYDDHVKFMPDEQTRRDFTPRSYDNAARELTVEFALHSMGEVSDWARQAAVGQRVVIAGPRGSMIMLDPRDEPFCAMPTRPTLPPALSATAAVPLLATCPIAA
jgi:NADPH-dependent ferric siderophore reductase